MSTIKQSFAWWCVQKDVEDPAAFFNATRQIGYQGVELLPEELWSVARGADLVIASVGAGSLTHGLNRRENHDKIEVEVLQKLELAVRIGIPNIIVFSGNRMGLSDAEGAKNTIAGLLRLALMAESSGITLVLELLNSKVDHVDYMCDHTAWAVEVVAQVNSPRVKILYDIYHMQVMEGDIIRTIGQYGQHFGHIHTAGNPGRRDLDDYQELNYPAIMRKLKEIGYSGFVGQEFIPKGQPLTALSHAYQVCDI